MNIEDYFIKTFTSSISHAYLAVKNDIVYYISSTCFDVQYSNYTISDIIEQNKNNYFNDIYENLNSTSTFIVTKQESESYMISTSIDIVDIYKGTIKKFEPQVNCLKKKIRLEKIDKLLE